MNVVRLTAVFCVIVFSCAAANAGVNPPSAPEYTESGYTVTWPGPASNQLSTQLQERLPGGTWNVIGSTAAGQGSIYLVRDPGTYEYRTRAVEEFFHNQFEPDIRIVFSTPITVQVEREAVPLDDEYTQIGYRYEVRLADINGDGRTDIYIKRLDADPDNGVVYESVAYQLSDGHFAVQPSNASIIAAARSYPIADVIVNGGDLDDDGYSDPTIVGFPASANISYPQTFLSIGESYQRNARAVVTTDEAVAMFDRDLREARNDPNYFDNAGTPDEPGYRIEIVYEFGYCYTVYWFPICFSDTITIFVGEFSLSDLGLSQSSGSQSSGVQKPSGNSISYAASISIAESARQKIASVDPNVPDTLEGTESGKLQATQYFGLAESGLDTLFCVIWCNYWILFDYYGYSYAAWYDVWTPITIPGTFDDVNYSRKAYEAYQGEIELEGALNALPGYDDIGDILGQTQAQKERMHDGWGIPLPNPGVVIIPPILEGVSDAIETTTEAVRILKARWKIRKACKEAEDPEECIAAMEESVISDTEEGGLIGGVWGDTEMDEDNMTHPDSRMRRQMALLVAAVAAASSPGRWQCSYKKKHTSKNLWYYGITSAPQSSDCYDAVDRRSARHDRDPRFIREGDWFDSSLDRAIPPTTLLPGSLIVTRGVIRGREQQLIDSYVRFSPNGTEQRGIDARNGDIFSGQTTGLFNRIRSVSKRNPLGCLMWEGSNTLLGTLSPFTGIESFCIFE